MVEGFLNSKELAVFGVIQEYLSQNQFFRINDIIPFLNQTLDKSLNLNARGIEKIIHSLLKKHVVVPGYKLTWEDVLLNDLRNDIFEYINQNPAAYLNQIMKKLEIGSHQALWHLGILEVFKFIRKTTIGKKKIYFHTDLNPTYDKFHFYMKNRKVIRILELLQTEHAQSLTKTEMANELNMHYNTFKKYINILLDLKLVKKHGKKQYQIDAKTHKKIINAINH